MNVYMQILINMVSKITKPLFALLAIMFTASVSARSSATYGEDYTAPDSSLITHAVVKEFPMEATHIHCYGEREKGRALQRHESLGRSGELWKFRV